MEGRKGSRKQSQEENSPNWMGPGMKEGRCKDAIEGSGRGLSQLTRCTTKTTERLRTETIPRFAQGNLLALTALPSQEKLWQFLLRPAVQKLRPTECGLGKDSERADPLLRAFPQETASSSSSKELSPCTPKLKWLHGR